MALALGFGLVGGSPQALPETPPAPAVATVALPAPGAAAERGRAGAAVAAVEAALRGEVAMRVASLLAAAGLADAGRAAPMVRA